jgi:hypothetical protein
VRRRLRLVSAEASASARAVAVLGPPTPLGDVAALTGLDPEEVGTAVEALVAARSETVTLLADSASGSVADEQEVVEVLGVQADEVVATAAPVVRIPTLPPCLGRFWTVT